MDIESIFNDINTRRKANAKNLTLGKLEDKLKDFGDSEQFILSNEKILTGTYDSYRGYYEDIYFDYSDNKEAFNILNTVSQLKNIIKNAYRQGVMYGYKGGEYQINKNTLIWLAQYGDCGDMIVDIRKINGIITIIVKEENDD